MSAGGLRASRLELALPEWMGPFLDGWSEGLDGVEQRMRLAIALADENVARRTGGPFGAVVVDEQSGRLLGAGVNLVTRLDVSLAHAEMIAISLAQVEKGAWNLGSDGEVQLVTSCEPCAMCFGAVPWSGVSSLAWGASREDAEKAGFDEGDKPDDWAESLLRRGIAVHEGVLRAEAAAVLERYAHNDGHIYHPNRK